jgi:hypothetical protein
MRGLLRCNQWIAVVTLVRIASLSIDVWDWWFAIKNAPDVPLNKDIAGSLGVMYIVPISKYDEKIKRNCELPFKVR